MNVEGVCVYLFLFIALLTQVLPSTRHLCTTHLTLLGGQVLLDLRLYFLVSFGF